MRAYVTSALLAVAAVADSAIPYDWQQNGADWGTTAAQKDWVTTCQLGKEQSPINLTNATASDKPKITMSGYFNPQIQADFVNSPPW